MSAAAALRGIVGVGDTRALAGDASPYEWLAELLEYPGPGLVSTAERCRAALSRLPEAAHLVEDFASFAAGTDARALEELYTRTFDLSAPCCLDLGWQLFGETYDRGPFLVRLRLATRAHGIDPGAELPDHLSVVLRLLVRLSDEEEPALLVAEALLPAIDKMMAALASNIASAANPYRGLLRAASILLRADWPDARDATHAPGLRLPIVDDDFAPAASDPHRPRTEP